MGQQGKSREKAKKKGVQWDPFHKRYSTIYRVEIDPLLAGHITNPQ